MNEQLYSKHLECAAAWPRLWTSIQQIIDSNLQGEMDKHYENLNNKLCFSLQNEHHQKPPAPKAPTHNELRTRRPMW